MGVSKNSGTPKWMVKIMEIPIKMDDLGEKTLFSETPIQFEASDPEIKNDLDQTQGLDMEIQGVGIPSSFFCVVFFWRTVFHASGTTRVLERLHQQAAILMACDWFITYYQ